MIAEGLRDQAIAVDVAYDGEDAAVKLNLNAYDVVVLDRDLPGIRRALPDNHQFREPSDGPDADRLRRSG